MTRSAAAGWDVLFYLYKPVRKRELLAAMLAALGQYQAPSSVLMQD